jgi:hypothetical protein
MQSLLRSMRRLIRHPLMRETMGAHLKSVTDHFAQRYAFVGGHPRFVLARLQRMVQSALRLVDAGRRPWGLCARYLALVRKAVHLQSGLFCGRRRPMLRDNFCSICQSNDAGDWWWSMKCDHYFHVKCIFAHISSDMRCPLCRVAFV